MNDVERVLSWFADGTLVRPGAGPNTVDLAQALAVACGVDGVELGPGSRRIAEAIGEADHYVLALIDGLGMTMVERLPEDTFLRRHLAFEISAVFPVTTAASLTSIATGLPPGRHALPTWWTYLAPEDVSATVLPFQERFGERPLDELGITSERVFPVPSLFPRYARPVHIYQPAAICDSTYTRYFAGGPAVGYEALSGIVAAVADAAREATAGSFSYLYYPVVDTLAHAHGPDAPEVREQASFVDEQLSRLFEALPARSVLLVSADHGLVRVPGEAKHVLRIDDDLLELLLAPPSGEPRVPVFHVRPGCGGEFGGAFRRRFGEAFALLTPAEVEDLELLGPRPLHPETRARIGDFVALSRGLDVLVYGLPKYTGTMQMTGYHGGLTPDEMRIPLVVAAR